MNCAAYTAVDDAETHEAEAFALNAVGAANLAARRRDARRADGAGLHRLRLRRRRHRALCRGRASGAPSAYGRTKAAGEWAVEAHCPSQWIVRTAWLYGAGGRQLRQDDGPPGR